ncbi:hypothetical protein ECG_05764 [Echinococcus granulosus]|nr:hypothetical protein ECG_05764 [Echinococcus granulosus]
MGEEYMALKEGNVGAAFESDCECERNEGLQIYLSLIWYCACRRRQIILKRVLIRKSSLHATGAPMSSEEDHPAKMTLVPEPRPCLRVYMNALYQQRELDHFPEVDEICKGMKKEKEEVGLRVRFLMPSDPTYEMPFGRGLLVKVLSASSSIGWPCTSPEAPMVLFLWLLRHFELGHPLMMIDYLRQNCSWLAIEPRPMTKSVLLCFAREVANGMVYLASKDVGVPSFNV